MTALQQYRPIPKFPEYRIGIKKDVWSTPRKRAGKNGSVRILPGKQLKPDNGRVWLCQEAIHDAEPIRERHSVEKLFTEVWPELVYEKHNPRCRAGHPLFDALTPEVFASLTVEARVARWGCGNRVCLWCHPGFEIRDDTYSLTYGTGSAPDDWPASTVRAQPKPKWRRRRRYAYADPTWREAASNGHFSVAHDEAPPGAYVIADMLEMGHGFQIWTRPQ